MPNNTYLLRRADIDAMTGTAKTHFLNPEARRLNKSLGDATGLTGLGIHIISVEPGAQATELHRHFHEDECVYVLEGSATATIGEEHYQIEAGDFLGYRKGGAAHMIKNTGDKTLTCLVIGERTDHDVGEYPRLKKRIYRNAGLAWNVVDEANIEVLGADVGKK